MNKVYVVVLIDQTNDAVAFGKLSDAEEFAENAQGQATLYELEIKRNKRAKKEILN